MNEDNKIRTLFPRDYDYIPRSNDVNIKYKNEIKVFFNQLKNTKQFDIQQENELTLIFFY